VAGAVGTSCGGKLSAGGDGGNAGNGATGGGSTGGTTATGGKGGSSGFDAGKDVDLDPYVDPGCPDAQPPPIVWECDPYAAFTGCAAGEACYPFVQVPGGATGCNWDEYGTICAAAGTGQQGDPCDSANSCGSGYLCVKGAQPGLSCVRLCDPFGENTCPLGMICGEVDVEGIGGCF
jgi:hypothetical protein